ncbi:hypothetical protein [Nocardia jejuensis]|uniref:hypothetical protein n=1 Tax=Nocardia jejuensis TaxID=328049 RepID=UPI00082FEB11|nr:hypothetical protein [Nocardia jejuensis]
MPHDSAPANEPVMLSLTVPAASVSRGLTAGLVRPTSPDPGTAEILDLTADDEAVSEFLVRIVHSDSGFVARTDSAPRALAIIAATVAALCGEDIRTALTTPDLPFLKGLTQPAVEAFRDVLLAIESETPDAITESLTCLSN